MPFSVMFVQNASACRMLSCALILITGGENWTGLMLLQSTDIDTICIFT